MLKQLEGVPGVKWKSPTEPVLNLKALPVAQASASKQFPNQTGPSKLGKARSKKKRKLKKLKDKKTTTQRVIDSLDEYYQTARRSIKLADFMTELKIEEVEESSEDSFSVEICQVISVATNALTKEEQKRLKIIPCPLDPRILPKSRRFGAVAGVPHVRSPPRHDPPPCLLVVKYRKEEAFSTLIRSSEILSLRSLPSASLTRLLSPSPRSKSSSPSRILRILRRWSTSLIRRLSLPDGAEAATLYRKRRREFAGCEDNVPPFASFCDQISHPTPLCFSDPDKERKRGDLLPCQTDDVPFPFDRKQQQELKVDYCTNGCILYYNDDVTKIESKYYRVPRYKPQNKRQHKQKIFHLRDSKGFDGLFSSTLLLTLFSLILTNKFPLSYQENVPVESGIIH
ncbi:hypothetical protein IEQ34_012931 [Dendrobium chrysotoxum]|uniref:Uncharacterized protein n=1 Tax=Dendrobium chrysotoxum TaxID=161865 RepID=A0AAV7GM42_DENCH|nr:hypothetical protein IEQ34_012931 [Dendrobium chrysotoxum]